MKKELNLFDIIRVFFKYRILILKIVLIITLITLLISLIWPKTYKSTVRFFPPSRSNTGISGLLSNYMQPVVTTSELSPEALIVILQSRTIKEDVIQKFNLKEVYNSDINEFLIRKLEMNIEIEEIREGGFGFNPLIAVEFSFLDRNPERAAAVCKYYIEKTDTIIKKLNKDRAFKIKEIIEKRYLDNMDALDVAESNLKEFQEKNGIFEIESQTKSIINTMAELKAQIIRIDIEIDILKKVSSIDNTKLMQLYNEKAAFETKYKELYEKSESIKDEAFLHPLQNIPGLSKQYFSLFRDVTVQSKIYEIVYPQYEQAKMQVLMQAQGIQVLDPAKIPTYKYKPKRLFIVFSGMMFSVFLALLVIFIKELILKEKNDNSLNYQRFLEMRNQMKKDILFWKK